MLNKAKTLSGYTLLGLDGEIGQVKEFYFDDQYWTIRYLVADTGDWLTARKVLISPHSLVAILGNEHHIAVDLTKAQIEHSPSLNSDKPVSRQFEEEYYGYYKLPMYWGGPYSWGSYPYIVCNPEQRKRRPPCGKAWDPHLCSTHDVTGHHIQAADGEIGHVEDFIIDDDTWAIRYLIVDTRNWWPGKKVLVSPEWIERVSWNESKVFVNLTRETIKRSPEYTAWYLPTRNYEIELHQHYGHPGYWVDGSATESSPAEDDLREMLL